MPRQTHNPARHQVALKMSSKGECFLLPTVPIREDPGVLAEIKDNLRCRGHLPSCSAVAVPPEVLCLHAVSGCDTSVCMMKKFLHALQTLRIAETLLALLDFYYVAVPCHCPSSATR